MATINIPDSTHVRLREAAAAMHLPLDQFLDRLAGNVGAIGLMNHASPPGTVEWNKAFSEWIASHPARDFVADDSRDAIYGDERE